MAAKHTWPADRIEMLLNNNCHARTLRCIFPGLLFNRYTVVVFYAFLSGM